MKKIVEQLARMVAAGQKVRRDWNEVRLKEPVDEAILAHVKDEWSRVDAQNFARLKVLFAEHGYPDAGRFGEKVSHDFWLLVQHCDQAPGFQIEVLAAMEPLLKTGSVNPGNYAYLYDRVHVNTGQLQRYGTQLKEKDDRSGYAPKALEAPELVDFRRKKMGLSPLAEYLADHSALFPIK